MVVFFLGQFILAPLLWYDFFKRLTLKDFVKRLLWAIFRDVICNDGFDINVFIIDKFGSNVF